MVSHTYSKPRPRRYAPIYTQYSTYKEFLRDEFDFRCCYCLAREIWKDDGEFGIDHWKPKGDLLFAHLECVYENLVWACDTCNEAKKSITVKLEPLVDDFSQHVAFGEKGKVVGLTPQGKGLVRKLKLRDRSQFLSFVMDYVKIKDHSFSLKFPADLPDLTRKRPKVSGIEDCYFKQREQGSLPPYFVS